MKNQIQQILVQTLHELGITDILPEVEISGDPKNGDYTTNVAMRIFASQKSKVKSQKWKSSMEIALQVVEEVKSQKSKVKSETLDQNIQQDGQSGSAGIVENNVLQDIDHIEVAQPGFINIFLTEAKLSSTIGEVLKEKGGYGWAQVSSVPSEKLGTGNRQASSKARNMTHDTLTPDTRAKCVMVEFAHPNTHKAFHIGHLRNITTGESIVRLLESQGYEVIRANYQGDVGMHIAKCLYGILQVQSSKFKVQSWKEAKALSTQKRIEYLGEMYALGSKAFEEDPKAKEMIKDFNFLVYASAQRFSESKGATRSSTDYLTFVHGRQAELDEVYELWKETRQWSLDYFEMIYKRVGTRFDRYFFEGECLSGVDLAKEAVAKGILKESEGAIIFDGKPYGIDTRVFVNSLGLPTYEAKELALAQKETSEFGALDRIIHVVGPEQASFFTVTFKAEELLGMVESGVQKHLIYGWVKLKHGKMSSRSGVVVLGEWLLDEAKNAIYNILQKNTSIDIVSPSSSRMRGSVLSPQNADSRFPGNGNSKKYAPVEEEEIAEKAAVAAVKYSFLRVSTKSEIAFDLKESVNMEGDSGPYLQYTYARARSVLRKANNSGVNASTRQRVKPSDTLTLNTLTHGTNLNPEERQLARLIIYFPEIVEEAARNFAPSGLCTYLFNLAQAFNVFYAKHSILGIAENVSSIKYQVSVKNMTPDTLTHDTMNFRLALTAATAQVLKNGLYLLGIEVLEQM